MTQEDRVHLMLSLAVFAGIAAVAYADSLVVTISLGYLYILPLALSAMVHRLRVSLSLAAFCVLLHDALGPFAEVGWMQVGRNLLTLVGFVAVVMFRQPAGRGAPAVGSDCSQAARRIAKRDSPGRPRTAPPAAGRGAASAGVRPCRRHASRQDGGRRLFRFHPSGP